MDEKIKNAVRDVLEAHMFEFWLRFYFLKEKGDKLFMEVPEEKVAEIREKYPRLVKLVEMMNSREVTVKSSHEDLCAFLGLEFDGQKYGPNVVSKAMDSKMFTFEHHLFNLWAQGHELLLDSEWFDFQDWKDMFEEWKTTPEVRKYMGTLRRKEN